MAFLCPRAYLPRSPGGGGHVEDAVLGKGLALIGDFPLPQDWWDSVVPELYWDGLRDSNVRGASRWVS